MQEDRQQRGDMRGFHCLPIWLQGNQRVYEALSFKILKELKVAVRQYGLTAPFILGLVETLVSEPLPPSDCKAIAKACISGGDYLLWRSEFQDRYFDQYIRPPRSPLLLINWQGKANGELCRNSWISPKEYNRQVNTLAKQVWR
jgi:hypothetical protein